MDVTDLIVTGYSVLTVLGQGILLILLWFLLFAPEATFLRWARAHALPLMLVVAVLGTLGSLYFSKLPVGRPANSVGIREFFSTHKSFSSALRSSAVIGRSLRTFLFFPASGF